MAAGAEREDLGDRPIAELLKELSHQTATLVHQEMELARAELSQKGNQVRAGGAAVGAAAVIGLAAVGSLTACFILALAGVVPPWLSALVVGVVYAAAAAVLSQIGKDRLQNATPPVPEQTVESVKEDMQWAKTQVRSARR